MKPLARRPLKQRLDELAHEEWVKRFTADLLTEPEQATAGGIVIPAIGQGPTLVTWCDPQYVDFSKAEQRIIAYLMEQRLEWLKHDIELQLKGYWLNQV